MTNNAIDIHSEVARGSSGYAQIPDVTMLQTKMTTLGNILSRYGGLGSEALDKLSDINLKSMEFKRNQKLYSLCQGRAEIFIVKQGWVSLCHSIKNRGQDICNVYMPGDIVGIRESFFDNHDITLLALQNCLLDKVSVDDVHALFQDYSDIKSAVVSYIMVNDNIAIERLRSCTHHKAEERVAHFLLEVYARYKFKGMIDSNVFAFPITQEVVGELLGITNVHVSRCMTALEQKKMIRKSRNTIKLLEPELLAEYTGFDESLIYGHVRLV
ncbi:Crp/Fnr family transcriptional regulator [Vreelandella sulfidaeris]|uniref:Crp/Fnr family transcriptional regulator n=1 Tax=Vreelandella sulfidaeris TaxID=115553 RepID=A0A365TPT2_9GAMM|nr:Crp/Fnr family transcriptional regulator [Halomonas sulfidaeris]RBI67989.1 Crp/Fnr family transcriptional regulator [Halomonas sulfidaeris]|tara:strand:+ start:508 stop:1317 length:810 start_codon:yes stop_codon:yes gene_type:complete